MSITISKDELRDKFEEFMRSEYPEVAKGEMNDAKDEFYTRLGLFYFFTDVLFQPATEKKS